MPTRSQRSDGIAAVPAAPAALSLRAQCWADAKAALLFHWFFALNTHLKFLVAPWLHLSPTAAGLALSLTLLYLMALYCARHRALFNPANNAAAWALGQGTAREHFWRSVWQVAGAFTGAGLALWVLPADWTKHLHEHAQGLRGGAGLLDGAACEFCVGGLLAWVVLVFEDASVTNSTLKLWVPQWATVLAIKAGEPVTGPSLNSAFTAAWVLLFPGSQGLAEHFVVFWAAPVASGVFAAWAYLGWKQWAAQRQQQAARAKAD